MDFRLDGRKTGFQFTITVIASVIDCKCKRYFPLQTLQPLKFRPIPAVLWPIPL
jgi:hypothetical protein